MAEVVAAFAPATIGNVGPGFDVLGLALEQPGDTVVARRSDRPGAQLVESLPASGPWRNWSDRATPADRRNTAAIAAERTLEQLGVGWGVELELRKGLPVGSGLGSSGASAAAAAFAVNLLAETALPPEALLVACGEAERSACGAAHLDNVAPALLGGIVLLRPDGVPARLTTELPLAVALLTPRQRLDTAKARAALPEQIPLSEAVCNWAAVGALIYGLAAGELELIRAGLFDRVAEPRRAPLVDGFAPIKRAALDGGALGASISGAGPTIFALCESSEVARGVERAMHRAADEVGVAHHSWVSRLAAEGARRVDASPA